MEKEECPINAHTWYIIIYFFSLIDTYLWNTIVINIYIIYFTVSTPISHVYMHIPHIDSRKKRDSYETCITKWIDEESR